MWRAIKYEDVYLKAHSIADPKTPPEQHFAFCNTESHRQSLDRRIPDSVYYSLAAKQAALLRDALITPPN